ncbi:hypothetical protein acdb102_00860 [Acidothermaceae bacterium B102]|nr:hypothetical protein acdb102_00860 [Acidothermaceae bacterium B102]
MRSDADIGKPMSLDRGRRSRGCGRGLHRHGGDRQRHDKGNQPSKETYATLRHQQTHSDIVANPDQTDMLPRSRDERGQPNGLPVGDTAVAGQDDWVRTGPW